MMENLIAKIESRHIPAVYSYIHKKLLERLIDPNFSINNRTFKDSHDGNQIIGKRDLKIIMTRFMVPLEIHNVFLKEMEYYGLIKRKNRKKIEIIGKPL